MARQKKFNWGKFPVKFLKAVLYSEKTPLNSRPPFDFDDADQLAAYMFYPTDYFVKTYREEIEDNFLTTENHLENVVRTLEEMNHGDFHVGKPEKMMATLKKARLTSALINAIQAEILSVGTDGDFKFKTKFPKPRTIDLNKSTGDESDVNLRPYQERAVLELRKHFLDADKPAGILQMPTGSGKTLTAVYFLLTEMTARGWQILWLAHRSLLIEQAASVFYKFAPLVKINPENALKKFNMICVSSDHCPSSTISRKDNLIVSMVPSLYYNKRRLRSILQEKVIVVVDEAHHTTAPSYRTIIDEIRKHNPNAKLLGLTATPMRGTDKETKMLWKIFDSTKPVFEITMNQLISNGTLSKPIPKTIETNVDIETIIDDKEIAHIQRMHEMPESLVNKIARTNARNDIIVDEYIKNAETIARFRDNKHPEHIDVLININMLTEGSDIPDIQTVFLTRPTSSDVLLMQMVGRGMRGLDAGGTATVNIVDFCDKWSDITRWFNPKFLFDISDTEFEPIEKINYEPISYTLYPWDLIRAVMRGITYKGAQVIKADTVLPCG